MSCMRRLPDVRHKLKSKIVALRRALAAPGDEIAWEVAGTRRYGEILFRDLKEWIKTQFDGTNARIDAIHGRLK
jgi:exoribonuclease II